MGLFGSKPRVRNPFTGRAFEALRPGAARQLVRPDYSTRGRCANKPAYTDARGFALQVIYRVPNLNSVPPSVYSQAMAEEDIRACAAGRDLVHASRVVRYDKIAGKGSDPRWHALRTYHGYTDAEIPQALRVLPYSPKMAQVDISSFQQTGQPYYRVIKQTSTVINAKRQVVRNWRSQGFDDKFKYDVYDPRGPEKRLGAKPEMRFDVTKYPIRKLKSGQLGRMIPCAAMPSMCAPGMTEFPHVTGQERDEVERKRLENLRNRNARRKAQSLLNKKMSQLQRRIKGAENAKNTNKLGRLTAQRNQLRTAFNAARRGGAPPPGPTTPNGRPKTPNGAKGWASGFVSGQGGTKTPNGRPKTPNGRPKTPNGREAWVNAVVSGQSGTKTPNGAKGWVNAVVSGQGGPRTPNGGPKTPNGAKLWVNAFASGRGYTGGGTNGGTGGRTNGRTNAPQAPGAWYPSIPQAPPQGPVAPGVAQGAPVGWEWTTPQPVTERAPRVKISAAAASMLNAALPKVRPGTAAVSRAGKAFLERQRRTPLPRQGFKFRGMKVRARRM